MDARAANDPEIQRLRRRYTSLGAGELTAAALFSCLAVIAPWPILDGPHGRAGLWSALIPLLVILAQAGVYWLLARGWLGGTMPAPVAACYRAFRLLNPVLLLAGLVGAWVWRPTEALGLVFVLAVWAFGVIEHLNYYVVRLSYPARVWASKVTQWRTPRLAADLRAAR